MEQRPAPVVSISDPARPGTPGDLLSAGSERDPWRLRRGHVKAGALAVALLAAAVVPGRVVAARAADGRAATAAADAVALAVPAATADALGLVLANDGPTGLRLVDVRVDAPGYRRVPLHTPLGAHSTAAVALRDTRTCGEDLVVPGDPGDAEVRGRTSAGRLVVRTVAIPLDAWVALVEAAQRRCGFLPPEQAVRATAVLLRRGTRLSVRLTVHNTGRVPLLLGAVTFLGAPLVTRPVGARALEVPAGATRQLDAGSSAACRPPDSADDGRVPGVDLQVQPVLAHHEALTTTVTVTDPALQRQLAALPTCPRETVSQADAVTVG